MSINLSQFLSILALVTFMASCGQLPVNPETSAENSPETETNDENSYEVSGSIVIENGATFSTNRTVQLALTASEATVQMKISENVNFVNQEWEPIAATKSYTFDSDGTKTLYVVFANQYSLETTYSSSIAIDTQAPSLANLTFGKCIATEYKPTDIANMLVIKSPTGLELNIPDTDSDIASVVVTANDKTLATLKAGERSVSITEDFSGPICIQGTDTSGNKGEPECKSSGYIFPKVTSFFDKWATTIPSHYINAYLIGSNGGTPHTYIAQSFTPKENMTIQTAITSNFFYMGSSEAQLRADNAGVPGSVIASTSNLIGSTIGNDSCDRQGFAYQFANPISLIADQRYWLVKHALTAATVQYQDASHLAVDTTGEQVLRSTDGTTWDIPCFAQGTGSSVAGCSINIGVY